MAIKIKIIKEERRALLEFAPEEVGDGDGYLSWDAIADMYIHNSKNMSEKQWLQPDNSEWYSGHHFEQKYQIARDRACFAALGSAYNYLFKDRLRDHMISKGVLPEDAPKPPVSFFKKILKYFDKKFGLVNDATGFHNCGNYYGVETNPKDTAIRDLDALRQTGARHRVVTGDVDKLVADLDSKEIKMSKKYSSFKEQQIMTENLRKFLKEGDDHRYETGGSLNPKVSRRGTESMRFFDEKKIGAALLAADPRASIEKRGWKTKLLWDGTEEDLISALDDNKALSDVFRKIRRARDREIQKWGGGTRWNDFYFFNERGNKEGDLIVYLSDGEKAKLKYEPQKEELK